MSFICLEKQLKIFLVINLLKNTSDQVNHVSATSVCFLMEVYKLIGNFLLPVTC